MVIAVDVAQPAPWEAVPASKQLFVLITGANSGVGLGIGQRLIDEFLATRPLDAHLILIPTTRSPSKSLEAIRDLRNYAVKTSQSSPGLRSRVGEDAYRWQDTVARIHVISLALDLCDLRGIRAVARKLCSGTVSNPEGLDGEYVRNFRIPRLDSVICNAAFGGWSGCDYPLAVWHILTRGLVNPTTWPEFKNALPTCILNEQAVYSYPEKPLLGEVFCACVFGHYMLSHELLPLLSRSASHEDDGVPRGRVIWTSSIEAVRRRFDIADFQGFTRPEAYESAKRLTDILALTYSLPSVRQYSTPFLSFDSRIDSVDNAVAKQRELPVPPKIYLTHPGVVVSSLFPVPWFLLWAYELALVISRWLGSAWHNIEGYRGAKSAVWVTMEQQSALNDARADRIKWGSATDHALRTDVKITEVEGWGWEGKVEDPNDDAEPGIFRKTVGRKLGVVDATESGIIEFEETGAEIWKEMERLRLLWSDIIDDKLE